MERDTEKMINQPVLNPVVLKDGSEPLGEPLKVTHGKLHRDNDLPAIIYSTRSEHWYQNGIQHRDNDQPAVITLSGDQYW